MPLYWIWFAELKNLTLWQKQKLLDAFCDPEEIYGCHTDALKEVAGIDERALAALGDKDLTAAQRILKNCAQMDIKILTCREARYPARLKNIEDPPVVLYYKGILPDWEERPVIGVVGTRKASAYGMRSAHMLSQQLAACGGLVITGGADGIDTAALEGALAAEKPAVAVFGGGADVIYPKKNGALFEKVLKTGCILSEYPPKTAPSSWHFPRRNRILSGISNGVLVVEAPEHSGALNTAEHAFTQGRDVYTVPGNLGVDSCVGSNLLMQRGAYPVIAGWDIIRQYETLYPGKVRQVQIPLQAEEMPARKVAASREIPGKDPGQQENAAKKSIDNLNKSTYSVLNERLSRLTEEEASVYGLLTDEPQFPDGVIAQSELPAGTVQSLLTKLALKGLVQNHSGGRISRK